MLGTKLIQRSRKQFPLSPYVAHALNVSVKAVEVSLR